MNHSLPSHALYYKSLIRNMVLAISLVSLIPVFLVSSLIYYDARNAYKEKVRAHLQELVGKHKQHIDGFLNARLSDIRFLAADSGTEELRNETLLQEKLARLQRAYGPVFVDLGLVDDRGRQVAYAGPFDLGHADYAAASWFRQTQAAGAVISDVFLGLRGHPHFIVAVRTIREGAPWILRATINFESFNALVQGIRIGETGFAFILNKAGELQTTGQVDFRPGAACYGFFAECREAAVHPINYQERTDEAGVDSIYVTALLKNNEWLLVYKQHLTDAFAGLERTQRFAIFIFLLGGLAVVSMSLVVSVRLVGRIAVADREKESMNRQVIETGKLASLGELAAGVAHEINNPVAIMVEEAGWITDLLGGPDATSPENLKEFSRALAQIQTQGKRCKEITHKLLSFARRTDPRVREIDINEIIKDIAALSVQRAKFSDIEIQTHLQPDLPQIEASESEIQQVLLNMINNALCAMERTGGVIDMRSAMQEGTLMITVADNGPGISAAHLPRIFDPFFTTKPVGQGTGLGLSICYGIIHKMGGEIEAQSAEGKGTTFTIRIPLKRYSD